MRKPFAIYAITKHGVGIGQRLHAGLPVADLYVSEKLLREGAGPGVLPLPLPMGPLLADTFTAYDCHVFVISVGAVVRMIAPLLASKKVDPAVVCVDDDARFAICLLSGHVGRGNALTDRVASVLSAQPVITTASDVRGTLTVDILGRELGWTLDDPDRNVTRACAAVVNAQPVLFVQECGEPGFWPEDKPLPEGVRYTTSLEGVDPARWEILLVATDRLVSVDNAVVYRPKSLVAGIGCDRDTPPDLVARGLHSLLERHGLSAKCVREVASIDVKREEPALHALGLPLRFFTAAALDAVDAPTPSETVKRHVGTRGVAEPAALLAAGTTSLLVAKQVYSEPGAGRSMTLAVARIPHPSRREMPHG